MTFLSWRLNEPIEERYRPTKIHALKDDSDPERTLCGLLVPTHPYDEDRRFALSDLSCGHCERHLDALRAALEKPKRGYSTNFTPADKDTAARYLLDNIPGALWRRVADKCKRDGVSRRAVILQLLNDWSQAS